MKLRQKRLSQFHENVSRVPPELKNKTVFFRLVVMVTTSSAIRRDVFTKAGFPLGGLNPRGEDASIV